MPNFEENPNALREALESAVTAIEPETTEVASPAEAPATAPTAPAVAPAPSPTYLGSPTPAPTSAPTPSAAPAAQDPTAAAAPAVAAEPPAPNDPSAKAPGSWTPAAREEWATLSPNLKQEVWKREREASRALTVSTEARKWQDDFNKTMQPYLGFIAAENSTPLAAVNNMMQTAAALRVGTPQQKVQVAAEIIKNFGIDLQALDSVLAGQQAQFNPQTNIDQAVQRAIAPVMQRFQQQDHFENQRFQQQVDNDLGTFVNAVNADGTPKHEFFADVGDVMADLVEVASRRGQSMSLTEAYERAIIIHEPVRRVIEARKQRQAATDMTHLATQAKGTAVSVTPSTEVATAVPNAGNSLRASIEAAINAQQGR